MPARCHAVQQWHMCLTDSTCRIPGAIRHIAPASCRQDAAGRRKHTGPCVLYRIVVKPSREAQPVPTTRPWARMPTNHGVAWFVQAHSAGRGVALSVRACVSCSRSNALGWHSNSKTSIHSADPNAIDNIAPTPTPKPHASALQHTQLYSSWKAEPFFMRAINSSIKPVSRTGADAAAPGLRVASLAACRA
jgi:hypothetical protein